MTDASGDDQTYKEISSVQYAMNFFKLSLRPASTTSDCRATVHIVTKLERKTVIPKIYYDKTKARLVHESPVNQWSHFKTLGVLLLPMWARLRHREGRLVEIRLFGLNRSSRPRGAQGQRLVIQIHPATIAICPQNKPLSRRTV